MPELLEVTFTGTYYGQNWVNRFNYVGNGTPAAVSYSFALASSLGCVDPESGTILGTTLFGAWRLLVSSNVNYQLVSVWNVGTETDFYSVPLDAYSGTINGDDASPVLSFGFRTNQVTKAVRRGQKRFVGITDAQTVDAAEFTGGTITSMDLLATRMSEVLSYDDEGNTLTFSPAVVSREKYTTSSGKTAYRYYDDIEVQLAHTAVGVVWSRQLNARSQVSRQFGRGR